MTRIPRLFAHRARARQGGSIMVIVMVLLAALLSGGALALYLQVSDTRSGGLVRASRSALYCAEAGLNSARPVIGGNTSVWNDLLDGDPSNDPVWYPVRGDIDGDGVDDYEVTVRDNDDELPNPTDRTVDNDAKIFVVSRCLKYPESPREILELIEFSGGGSTYRNQSGQGSGNTGNAN